MTASRNDLPLFNRAAQDTVFYTSIAGSPGHYQALNCKLVMAVIHELAATLPEQGYAMNLCGSRLHFFVSFCAVIIRGQCNLLPPNRHLETQNQLAQRYKDVYIIHDGSVELETGIHSVDISLLCQQAILRATANLHSDLLEPPQIPSEQLAAIVFTSGSTGQSKAIPKTWQTFTASTAINKQYFLSEPEDQYTLVATVPGQHMWGLETSILLPLFANISVLDAQPFFAAEIVEVLRTLPGRRMLASTPLHINTLCKSGLTLPRLDRVLCATAPLPESLAAKLEELTQSSVCEIYGCSEVGSMAYRYPAKNSLWQFFRDFKVSQTQNTTSLSADHMARPFALHDRLSLDHSGAFSIVGRDSDMVNIAGKRASLKDLNLSLTEIDGVLDGAIFLPEENIGEHDKNEHPIHTKVQRLAALVTIDQKVIDKKRLLNALRRKIDPVFMPRPLYLVDALPREESGKLTAKRLNAVLAKSRDSVNDTVQHKLRKVHAPPH